LDNEVFDISLLRVEHQTNTNRLMLFREIVGVYCWECAKHVGTLSGKSTTRLCIVLEEWCLFIKILCSPRISC